MPLLSGVVVGSIVAIVTGHALIALFGATALVAAVLAWGSMVLVHRRRSRLWRNDVRRRRHRRACHRIETIEWQADLQRRRHPPLDSLVRLVRAGDPQLWSRRPSEGDPTMWDVEVRRRSVDHDVDGYRYVCRDVPDTVSLQPGAIVGVHGACASVIARTLVVRLAAAVGPSDLDVVGTSTSDELVIPQWRGSVDRASADETEVHVVIVCTDPRDVASRTSPARRLVSGGRAALVVAAERRELLPQNCTAVIDAGDEIPDLTALDRLIEALSLWSDPDVVGSDVPSRVAWSDVYSPDDDLELRWSSSTGRCCVRLGLAADGRVDIDLVRDGPHMVVIGTTGSGKSELLRTLVLGLAAESPPDRVQFVLVDFKGGAAFDALRDLPHVVDVITDLDRDDTIDEEAGQRVVDGLRAELVRREHVLRRHGASSLLDLEVTSAHGEPIPPRLVIVIDELARLQADVPAFVAALVDLAQRGRSLGVHLVVGTQTPGRVVSSEVLANSDIRVALRLNSAGDSSEIIGSPISARLPRSTPGRAVVRLANDDPVVFQVTSTEGVLAATVDTIVDSARHVGVTRPQPIWCPPLPAHVSVDAVDGDVICVIDDRRHQSQPGCRWDGSSNVLVVGGRGSGTTAALATLADRWSARRRAEGDDPGVIVWFSGHEVDDHEMVDRALHIAEASGDRNRLVVVDGLDTWSDRQASSRQHLRLWERFGIIASQRSVVVIASSTRDPMGVSRLGERFDHVFVMRDDGPMVPGRCRIEKTSSEFPIGAAMQWAAPPDEPRFTVCRPNRLPTHIVESDDARFAIRASDHRPLFPDHDADPAFLVIGPRGSGRTTALQRWSESWAAIHGEAPTQWIDSTEKWSSAVVEERPGLLIIDDSSNLWNRLNPNDLDAALKNGWHVAAAVTPSLLRARSEHVLHSLRRHRTGLVLGSSAHDDVDLFGVFDLDLSFVDSAPGRGWFVDRGEVVDLVQVVVPAGPTT